MTRLLLTLLVSFVPLANTEATEASGSALLDNPVTQLMGKFESTTDFLYLALASSRCSGLLAVVQGVLKRDANKDVYVGVPDQLADVAWRITLVKLKERGVPLDDARLETTDKELNEDFTGFVKAYSERMTANRKANGDMWSSDPFISNDLEACKELAAAFAE
jgi:hypothetical protein